MSSFGFFFLSIRRYIDSLDWLSLLIYFCFFVAATDTSWLGELDDFFSRPFSQSRPRRVITSFFSYFILARCVIHSIAFSRRAIAVLFTWLRNRVHSRRITLAQLANAISYFWNERRLKHTLLSTEQTIFKRGRLHCLIFLVDWTMISIRNWRVKESPSFEWSYIWLSPLGRNNRPTTKLQSSRWCTVLAEVNRMVRADVLNETLASSSWRTLVKQVAVTLINLLLKLFIDWPTINDRTLWLYTVPNYFNLTPVWTSVASDSADWRRRFSPKPTTKLIWK